MEIHARKTTYLLLKHRLHVRTRAAQWIFWILHASQN